MCVRSTFGRGESTRGERRGEDPRGLERGGGRGGTRVLYYRSVQTRRETEQAGQQVLRSQYTVKERKKGGASRSPDLTVSCVSVEESFERLVGRSVYLSSRNPNHTEKRKSRRIKRRVRPWSTRNVTEKKYKVVCHAALVVGCMQCITQTEGGVFSSVLCTR
jgi:hypothetical protein